MPDPQQAQSTPQQSQTLAGMVRAKYPGAYDDLDDATLEKNVLAKYPQYSDLPRSQPQQQGTPITDKTTMQAQPSGVLPWLKSFEGDVRYGSQNTAPGKLLHFLGAQGVNQGSQAQAGDLMASPILGTTRAAQGVAELPSRPWQGTKDIVGGTLQAGQIPLSFLGGRAVNEAAEGLSNAIPSTERAIGNFQQVMYAAKNNPVQVTDELSSALSRYQQLVDNGGGRSMAVSKLINRVTDPSRGPLNYQDARDFASNISRLSADEFNRLTPVMKQQIGAIRVALNNTVGNTAEAAGQGTAYKSAMSEFARGSKLNETKRAIADYSWQQLKDKLPWLATVGVGKKLVDALSTNPPSGR